MVQSCAQHIDGLLHIDSCVQRCAISGHALCAAVTRAGAFCGRLGLFFMSQRALKLWLSIRAYELGDTCRLARSAHRLSMNQLPYLFGEPREITAKGKPSVKSLINNKACR